MIFNPLTVVSGVSQIFGGFAMARAAKAERDRQREIEDEAREERNKMRNIYMNLDTSNPYENMENVMQDLTINQQQAQFERQTFAQSQSNILQSLQGSAGGSGIAALAQSLAQQGQIAAQRSAASIGQQETANIQAERGMAAQLQQLQRQGRRETQQMNMQKFGTLQQMSQQEMMQAGAAANQAEQQRMSALGSAIGGIGTTISGFAGDSKIGDEGYEDFIKFQPFGGPKSQFRGFFKDIFKKNN
tara:strand:- start:50 stop:784 length:735 start_codon:yes stop_codon:yes gene_type:complete